MNYRAVHAFRFQIVLRREHTWEMELCPGSCERGQRRRPGPIGRLAGGLQGGFRGYLSRIEKFRQTVRNVLNCEMTRVTSRPPQSEVTVTGQLNPVQIAAQLLLSFGLADRSTAEESVYAREMEVAVYVDGEPPGEVPGRRQTPGRVLLADLVRRNLLWIFSLHTHFTTDLQRGFFL